MNIQDKMQEIHHKYGVTEKANYEIQLFIEDLIEKDRAEQLILHGVVFSEAELKAKLNEQLEETRQWLIDEDFEGLAERL